MRAKFKLKVAEVIKRAAFGSMSPVCGDVKFNLLSNCCEQGGPVLENLTEEEIDRFKVGQEYYIDFTPVSQEPQVSESKEESAPVLDKQNPDYPKVGDRFIWFEQEHTIVRLEGGYAFSRVESGDPREGQWSIDDTLINLVKAFKSQNKPHIS